MEITQKQNNIIVDFINNFKMVVDKNKWISHYDTDTDSLAMRTPNLSRSVRKKYINNEVALYLDEQKGVQGVFIEYFRNNMISHHKKELKTIEKQIANKRNKMKDSVVELKATDTKKMASKLGPVILSSMISEGIRCNN